MWSSGKRHGLKAFVVSQNQLERLCRDAPIVQGSSGTVFWGFELQALGYGVWVDKALVPAHVGGLRHSLVWSEFGKNAVEIRM